VLLCILLYVVVVFCVERDRIPDVDIERMALKPLLRSFSLI
jgi:hypothetical protein